MIGPGYIPYDELSVTRRKLAEALSKLESANAEVGRLNAEAKRIIDAGLTKIEGLELQISAMKPIVDAVREWAEVDKRARNTRCDYDIDGQLDKLLAVLEANPVVEKRKGPCATCGHNEAVHSASIRSGNGVGCTWWACGCGEYKAKED